jgi:prolyl-tRNA editing enzyme YbaK/EbsC (Cys-tRNA(Pro) deacylase)
MQQEENIKEKILKILEKSGYEFSWITHAEARDSKSAELASGISLQKGIKSLIVRGKKSGKNFLFCLRGDQKVDWKKVGLLLKEPASLEEAQIVEERFQVTIGTLSPFAFLYGLDLFFEESLLECKEVVFSGGRATDSVCMECADLVKLTHPTIGSFAKK